MSNFECKLLSADAKAPIRATTDAAGYDLYGVSMTMNAAGVGIISTNIALQIPHGYCGIIMARSSYAFKYGMQILAGVIDSDYRDEIKILYRANNDFKFEPGERCAQILIKPVLQSAVTVVDEFSEDGGDRTGGFGSTGVQ